MIRVVPPLTIQISLTLPRMLRTPPRILPNQAEFHPNVSRIWPEWNLSGPYSGPFFRVFGWIWTFQSKSNPSTNVSEFFTNFRPFGEGEQNAPIRIKKFGCICSWFGSSVTEALPKSYLNFFFIILTLSKTTHFRQFQNWKCLQMTISNFKMAKSSPNR